MAFITCKNIALGYDGKTIVEDLCFELTKGDYLCIVGENGTGKSTLIKTLLRLKEVQSGEIIVGDGLIPNEIGYLPQQTIIQKDFPATVWEIVISGTLSKGSNKPFYARKDKELAEKTLKGLGIWELRKQCYRYLSGGQQQRTLLARALCAATKIILLDEPITGLDPKVTAEFYSLLSQLNRNGMTIIMVSHDLQAISYATHILHISKTDSFYGDKESYLQTEKGKRFLSMGEKQK